MFKRKSQRSELRELYRLRHVLRQNAAFLVTQRALDLVELRIIDLQRHTGAPLPEGVVALHIRRLAQVRSFPDPVA